MRHDFADGKYSVLNWNGVLTALRNGEPWGRDLVGDNLVYWMLVEVDRLKTAAAAPIDMVLHCPVCSTQHIDAPKACDMGIGCTEAGCCYAAANREPDLCPVWTNPPHRSHLCHSCGHVWRPADVCTNGVAAIKTHGKNDSPIGA